MREVDKLTHRVKEALEIKGIQMHDENPHHKFLSNTVFTTSTMNYSDWQKGVRYIRLYDTHRNNGTPENVTVTIAVEESGNLHCSRVIERIKVPKNASDKVIANRVAKAIELL